MSKSELSEEVTPGNVNGMGPTSMPGADGGLPNGSGDKIHSLNGDIEDDEDEDEDEVDESTFIKFSRFVNESMEFDHNEFRDFNRSQQLLYIEKYFASKKIKAHVDANGGYYEVEGENKRHQDNGIKALKQQGFNNVMGIDLDESAGLTDRQLEFKKWPAPKKMADVSQYLRKLKGINSLEIAEEIMKTFVNDWGYKAGVVLTLAQKWKKPKDVDMLRAASKSM